MNTLSSEEIQNMNQAVRTYPYVYIKSDILTTQKKFGAGPEMHSMAGNREKYKIEDFGNDWVYINGYTWDIADIALPENFWGEKPERLVVKFDPTEILT